VLGLSLSCEFVARAAVQAPPRYRRLALVSPTGFAGRKRRYGPVGGSVGAPWLLRAFQGPGYAQGRGWGRGLFRQLTRPGVVRYFLQRTWGRPQIDEALWRYCVATARQPGAEHAPLHFLGARLFSTDVNALYEALQHPVWASHGTRGDFTDYRGLDTLKWHANWRVTPFAGCGALMYFEQPAVFAAELDAFLG
jgi:pimeloyl-ACP methyl ester carboxylesterase